MTLAPQRGLLAAILLCLAVTLKADNEPPQIAPGSRFAAATLQGVTYEQVTVLDVTPTSLVLRHHRGLVSLPLAELSPAWQEALGYDPSAARTAAARREKSEPPLEPPAAQNARPAQSHAFPDWTPPASADAGPAASLPDALASLQTAFGREPRWLAEVDFSDELLAYPTVGFTARAQWQGPRPSCAIYAITGAAELQYARREERFYRFSERYLDWAVRHLTGRERPPPGEGATLVDSGYSLRTVLAAINLYGILDESVFGDVTDASWETAPDPTAAEQETAAAHPDLAVLELPGGGDATVKAIMLALEAEQPVVVGLRWPQARGTWHGVISRQTPREDYAHAVTVFGYQSDGTTEGTRFKFRNSWGRDWGVQGWGWVTYPYLRENVLDAVVIDYLAD